jgi:uncharacterized membrane protein YfcA
MDFVFSDALFMAGIVFFSYTAQSISGFGSTVIAVTLGAHFFSLHLLIPALVFLDLLLNGYLTARYAGHIRQRILWVRIIPFMAAGVAAGLLLFDILAGPALKKILGLFVMGISAREVVSLFTSSQKMVHPVVQKVFFTLAGVIHGLYASGGPLVVYAASRLPLNKTGFRAVLTALWSILSAFMTLFFIYNGQWTGETVQLTLILLPSVAAGLTAGEILHKKLTERHFRFFVYIVLFAAGATLL